MCEVVEVEGNTREESPYVGLVAEEPSSSLFRNGCSVGCHS